MRIRRCAETGPLSCGRAERPTELASQVHPTLGMRLWRSRLLAELASRGNSSPKALFVNRDQAAHGIGIARHPGLKIIESLTELASRAFFRGIGIAIKKIDSRNWHREGNYPRNWHRGRPSRNWHRGRLE